MAIRKNDDEKEIRQGDRGKGIEELRTMLMVGWRRRKMASNGETETQLLEFKLGLGL
ncbi:uncharacterized protein DS421_17g600240 [Arachis hypogaea]|nr:uncharacterized protein DS421_17g600240 [Arachis hypogaea]